MIPKNRITIADGDFTGCISDAIWIVPNHYEENLVYHKTPIKNSQYSLGFENVLNIVRSKTIKHF